MKHLYESHLGGLYTSEDVLDYDELYCEQCDDSDTYLGSFETLADLWALIKDDCSIDGSGGWSLQYIYPWIVAEFDLPHKVEAAQGFCCLSDAEILQRIEKENA